MNAPKGITGDDLAQLDTYSMELGDVNEQIEELNRNWTVRQDEARMQDLEDHQTALVRAINAIERKYNPATPPPQPYQMTQDEWEAEAVRRFGDNTFDWRFKCCVCHRVYSIGEFVAAGGTAGDASQHCIGRVNGRGFNALRGPGPDGNKFGCDYTAIDLFTSEFRVIRRTVPIPIMPFAPAAEVHKEGGQEQ